MHPIEQRIYDDNLRTAWAMAGDWPSEHQAQLADLVVERFIRPIKAWLEAKELGLRVVA